MLRVAFCISGRGRLARSALACRTALGFKPVLILTDEKADPSLEPFAQDVGTPFVRLDVHDRPRFDRDLEAACVHATPDLIVLTFDKLVPATLVARFPHAIVNVHLSLLPAFRGFGALRAALEAGVKFAGATLHLVGTDVDGGPIITQGVVPVRADDTPAALGTRIYGRLLPMYLQVLAWYAAGRVWHDTAGRVWIRDADYGDCLTCPAIEPGVAALARRLSETPEEVNPHP
ncbi:MAG: phosphoribosylglycinamide formyltransferase [Phycisphaerae bacterium]|nr:phosphoribosylglycinamide formyltransferase [Phycisphaerae bacterium]